MTSYSLVECVWSASHTDDGDANVAVEIERLLGDLDDLVGGERRLADDRHAERHSEAAAAIMRAHARASVAHRDERVIVREDRVPRAQRQTLEHRIYTWLESTMNVTV